MPVNKIVLTGGPCAGKSTALKYIEEYYPKLGFRVIAVPEGATELMLRGITHASCGSVDEFEKRLLKYQIEQENKALAMAGEHADENVLIVCDRGTIDCRSYMTGQGYEKALADLGCSNVALRDSYDAVFHMVSAACGIKDHYSACGNSVRLENAAEAAAADGKLLQCWIGHPHLRVIGCAESMEEKLDALTAEISFFLGVPQPLEIERKFLIEYPDLKALDEDPFCHRVEISQTYLEDSKGSFRVRKRGENGDYLYFLTRKKKISGITRTETEVRINGQEYSDLMRSAKPPLKTIEKHRYCRIYKNRYFEIDVFPFWKDRALMEIELKSEDEEYELPGDIKVIREVSSEKKYTNKSIAEKLAAGSSDGIS